MVRQAQVAVYKRSYDEALTLMVEARNYVAYVEPRYRGRFRDMDSLRLSCEAMRVTSRLTQVMAWLMMQRAAQDGEVSVEEALAEHNRLAGQDVCLNDTAHDDETLPASLRSLLERSHNLYARIARLESMVLGTMH